MTENIDSDISLFPSSCTLCYKLYIAIVFVSFIFLFIKYLLLIFLFLFKPLAVF